MIVPKIQLSSDFWLNEAVRTSHTDLLPPNILHALYNLDRVYRVAYNLQMIRNYFGVPIDPTSWVRCALLNSRVGGSPASFHMLCLAVDYNVRGFHSPEGRLEVIRVIKNELELPIGKLIDEQKADGTGWIHQSEGVPYRNEASCGKVYQMRNGIYTDITNEV